MSQQQGYCHSVSSVNLALYVRKCAHMCNSCIPTKTWALMHTLWYYSVNAWWPYSYVHPNFSVSVFVGKKEIYSGTHMQKNDS